VVRPVHAPCGERTALSWDRGALRGHHPTRCHGHGFRGPARRFNALRACAGRAGRADCSARRPPCAFRFPSEVHRSTPAPSRNPEGSLTPDDASSPGLLCPTTHAGTADPLPAGLPAPRRATSEVWVPPSRRPPPILRKPCGPRASTGFRLRGVLLAPVGLPLGSPALLPFSASIRLAPIGACGRGRLQGLDPGDELVQSVEPLRARRADASMGFFPSERSPPPSLRALHGFAPAPPPRVGRDDVPTRLRLEVLRNGGIG
jgi:hypothetical protein